MREYLKVKIKSLAAEAAIIRRTEEKYRERWLEVVGLTARSRDRARSLYWGLRQHRIGVLRDHTRETLLAYAFVRGKSYAATETASRKNGIRPPDYAVVHKMVVKYGDDPKVTLDDVKTWVTGEKPSIIKKIVRAMSA
jgi:hypothetical protein